ncbi:hypothetical protein [Sporosarcina sp. FSL K6-5500]|uniref:hypothetical protein n=1 Tax=Sporosarcina sp. FSL K6-5500 TaxID=2921558 RepID=UPI0030FB8D42
MNRKQTIVITIIAVIVVVLIAGIVTMNNKEKNGSVDGEQKGIAEGQQDVNEGKLDEAGTSKTNSEQSTESEPTGKGEERTQAENKGKDSVKVQGFKEDNETIVGKKEKVRGTVLNSLPKVSYEVQDNTDTDTWGVVLKHDQLPNGLKEAESYTITIGAKVYDLKLNKFNANVFNGHISSIEHTKEEVEAGIVKRTD